MIQKDAVYRVAMGVSRIFVRYGTFTPAGAPKLGVVKSWVSAFDGS